MHCLCKEIRLVHEHCMPYALQQQQFRARNGVRHSLLCLDQCGLRRTAKNGRLVLARGYGYADFEARETMQPDSMFRIASVSKVLTSMAVLHLKDQGLLSLDQKWLDILTEYQVPPGGDARHRDATIRNLLNHSGGWDASMAAEVDDSEIARTVGASLPLKTTDGVRWYLTRTLHFAPGSRFHYSNIGYCVLGPVIEKVSGQNYEHYVRDNVLLPMDVHAMSIASPGLAGRGPKEVKYYEYAGAPLVDSATPGQGKVPAPYAGSNMAYCSSSGSWIGSAVDLTRVMTAIDGSRVGPFLGAATMIEYTANPNLPPYVPNEWWGLGIGVGPTPDAWSHGGFASTVAILQRTSTYTWAVITNSWPLEVDNFVNKIHRGITDALKTPFEGSASDLYAQYPSPTLPASEP